MGKRRHIKHYRTDRLGGRPFVSQLEYGEIAINYADTSERLYIKNNINELVSFMPEKEANKVYQPKGNYLTEHQDISGKANVADVYTKTETEGYVTAQIDNLVNGAPQTMDTLKELADAIGENETIIDGLNNLVNEKADIDDVYDKEEIDDKVANLQKNIDEIDLGEYDCEVSRFIGYTQNAGEQYEFRWNGETVYAHDGEEVFITPIYGDSAYCMFNNCTNLTALDVSNFDTSNVTNMNGMFYCCTNLTALDVSNFDTSNVTNMGYMFAGDLSRGSMKIEELDLSNFDTSNVTNMSGMFYCCPKLTALDLSNFDTSNVTNMSGMFYCCYKLTALDVSNFNTSNVEDMSGMLQGCSKLTSLDVSNFDTSKVTNMSGMFGGMLTECKKLLYITLGENFFKTTQTIPFDGATNLGLNEDNTDNGWLEHLATVAPQIADGQTRTIQLPNKLKNAEWASAHIATLQAKGYTIA